MSGGEGLTAALLQLAEHAERLARLDDKLAVAAGQLADIALQLAGLSAGLTGQAEALGGIRAQLDALAGQDSEPEGKGYTPGPALRWWLLDDGEKAAAVRRLKGWVEVVYRPVYGHQAGKLPVCWPQHPLAVITLDWLSELHSVLYLQPKRSARDLASAAEWQLRLLPGAMDQIVQDAKGCGHAVKPAAMNGAAR